MTRKLKETYEEWSLEMNVKKTKYLSVGDNEIHNLRIDDSNEIEACEEYKYLGVIFDKKGTDEREIRAKIVQAKKWIGCLNGILWNKHITKRRKYNIYNAIIKSSLLYGSETWRITERSKRMLETTEMDALKRSARISRADRIRNEEIQQRMEIQDTIMDDIERKQLTWYGYVQRMEDHRLPEQVMTWMPHYKRKKGRSKKTWDEGIRRAMSERNLEEEQWENRRKWRLDIGQRRRTFCDRSMYIFQGSPDCYIYIYIYIM